MRRSERAGARRIAPAVLFVAWTAAALVTGGIPQAAAVPRDRFPDPAKAKTKPAAEAGPLDRAVARVAGELRSDPAYAPSEGAVRFLLHLYAQSGDVADRDRALALARAMQKRGGGSPTAFYVLAQAGAPTLEDAEAALAPLRGMMGDPSRAATNAYARFVQILFDRARAFRDAEGLGDAVAAAREFLAARTRIRDGRIQLLSGPTGNQVISLSDFVEAVRATVTAAEASGSGTIREDARLLARALIRGYWDDSAVRFRPRAVGREGGRLLETFLAVDAAAVVWEAGEVSGDPLLTGRGRRALVSVLDEAMKDRLVAPTAALAAARVSEPPLEMVLVGNPDDPAVTALRTASFFIGDPRRLLLNLDPVQDAGRIQELGYPTDMSPVLFVCVGTICSAPLQSADGLEEKVRGIVALAKENGS